MKKEICIELVIMVIAFIIAAVLAPVLQKKQLVINPDREEIGGGPLGGNQKVLADFEWMRFINYLGQQQVIDESNVKEVTARIERLVSLDPKYERLYLDGLSFIRHADPKKTVEMLERACQLDYLKDNWKIPFYAGFIYARDTYDIHGNDETPLLAANHAKAAEYFKMAIERTGGKPEKHLVNSYIRELAKAEATGTAPDRENLARLRILYREWKKTVQSGGRFGTEEDVCLIPDLQERLLKAIQDAKNPRDIYDQSFAPGKETLELINTIRNDVLYNQHLCLQCLYPQQAGDKFCTHCGTPAEVVRGICEKCGEKLRPDATFCSHCGTPAKNNPFVKPVK